MKNKYYVVLINPKENSYISSEVLTDVDIANFDDVEMLGNAALEIFDKDYKKDSWVVLNWKRFEEEE